MSNLKTNLELLLFVTAIVTSTACGSKKKSEAPAPTTPIAKTEPAISGAPNPMTTTPPQVVTTCTNSNLPSKDQQQCTPDGKTTIPNYNQNYGGKSYIPNPGQTCPPGYYCNGGNNPTGLVSSGVLGNFYSGQDVVACMQQAISRGIPVSGGWPIFDGGIQVGAAGYSGGLGYAIDGINSPNIPFPHIVMLKVSNFLNTSTVQLGNPYAVYCIKQTSFLSSISYASCNPAAVIIYQSTGWMGLNALSMPGCAQY